MIVKYISIVLGAIFEVYAANKYVSIFAINKIVAKKQFYIIISLISIFQVSISFFFEDVLLMLCSLLMVFSINLLYESKFYMKIILSITYMVAGISAELLSSAIFMIAKTQKFEEIITNPQIYSLIVLMSKFITFLLIVIVKLGKLKFNTNRLKLKHSLIISILPITTIILVYLLYQIIPLLNNDILKTLFITVCVLLIFSNVVIFEVLEKQNRLIEAEYELKLLKDNISEQRKHYCDLQTSQEEIRKMRHNMKHTYLGVLASLKSGNLNTAITQIEKDLNIIDVSNKIIDTGYPAIDSVIENKSKQCEKLNINFNISCSYKNDINLNDIEIAVIVGNILDNAIRACEDIENKEKEIWGNISSDKENVMVNIKNSTNKLERIKQNYGLKSISHIATEHGGYAKFTCDDNIFTSYVILQN